MNNKTDTMENSPKLTPLFNLKSPHGQRGRPTNAYAESASSEESFDTFVENNMRLPWGTVDYHIYLSKVESSRDEARRLKECFLWEKDGFRNVTLQNDMDFDNVPAGENPTIIFLSLSLPSLGHIPNTKLVLGIDLEARRLQGWVFETDTPLVDYRGLFNAWEQGFAQHIMDYPIVDFLEDVADALTNRIEVLDVGIMYHYGISLRTFAGGFDTVVVIQLLQFIDDFADVLWEEGDDIRVEYGSFKEELRDILAEGSRGAWFACRDGLSIEEFRQKDMRKVAGSGIFWMQTAQDLRRRIDPHYMVHRPASKAPVTYYHEPVTWYPQWLRSTWALLLADAVLIILLFWFLDPGLKSVSGPFKQGQADLVGMWPSETEPLPAVDTNGWSLKALGGKITIIESLACARVARLINPLSWWNTNQSTPTPGVLCGWPSRKKVQQWKLFGWWPFQRHEQKDSAWWPLKNKRQSFERVFRVFRFL